MKLEHPCRAARAHFSDHMDGQPLGFLDAAMVRCHLTICPTCKRFQQSLEATRDALRALRDEEVTLEDPEPKAE